MIYRNNECLKNLLFPVSMKKSAPKNGIYLKMTLEK